MSHLPEVNKSNVVPIVGIATVRLIQQQHFLTRLHSPMLAFYLFLMGCEISVGTWKLVTRVLINCNISWAHSTPLRLPLVTRTHPQLLITELKQTLACTQTVCMHVQVFVTSYILLLCLFRFKAPVNKQGLKGLFYWDFLYICAAFICCSELMNQNAHCHLFTMGLI